MLHYLSFWVSVCLLPVNLAHISSLLLNHDQDMLSSRLPAYFTHILNKATKFIDPDIISVCHSWEEGSYFLFQIEVEGKHISHYFPQRKLHQILEFCI